MATVYHSALRTLIDAGAVRGVTVLGQPGGYIILIKVDAGERLLSQPRTNAARDFRTLQSASTYLWDVGIARFSVDATNYSPESLFRSAS